MNEDRLQSLLIYFAENNIDREDYDELMMLIKEAKTNTALHAAMDKIWKEISDELLFTAVEERNIYNRILTDPRFRPVTEEGRVRSIFSRKTWVLAAASLLLICSLGMGGYYLSSQSKKNQQVLYTEYAVTSGHRAKIKFPDGTVVDINADSKLRYPSSFTGKTREIYLEGEAYFDVAHDATRPFIVHTTTVNTQVLGTAFNISAYRGEKMSVAVERGKVSVMEGGLKLGVLTPNRKLDYDLKSKHANEYTIDVNQLISWKDGDLILKNTNLKEAVTILDRWYGVKIDLNSHESEKSRFSVSFLKKESLEEVLTVLSQLNGFNYTMKNGEVKIR